MPGIKFVSAIQLLFEFLHLQASSTRSFRQFLYKLGVGSSKYQSHMTPNKQKIRVSVKSSKHFLHSHLAGQGLELPLLLLVFVVDAAADLSLEEGQGRHGVGGLLP